MRRLSSLQAILLVAAFCAQNASAASVDATVSASVVESLIILNQQPLNFGHITPTAGGGSVVVTTANARNVNGGVQVSGGFNRASFKVQGAPSRVYSIHTPDSQLFVSSIASADPNLTNALTVNRFTVYSVNASSSAGEGQLSGGGQDDVYLGGTLIVPANAVPGVYSGLVPLTVSY